MLKKLPNPDLMPSMQALRKKTQEMLDLSQEGLCSGLWEQRSLGMSSAGLPEAVPQGAQCEYPTEGNLPAPPFPRAERKADALRMQELKSCGCWNGMPWDAAGTNWAILNQGTLPPHVAMDSCDAHQWELCSRGQ